MKAQLGQFVTKWLPRPEEFWLACGWRSPKAVSDVVTPGNSSLFRSVAALYQGFGGQSRKHFAKCTGVSKTEFTDKVNWKSGSSYSFDGYLPLTDEAFLQFSSSFLSASESVHPNGCVIAHTTWTLWPTDLHSAFTPQSVPNTRQLCGADFYWSFGSSRGYLEHRAENNFKLKIRYQTLEIYFPFQATENAFWLCGSSLCFSSLQSHSVSSTAPMWGSWASDNFLSAIRYWKFCFILPYKCILVSTDLILTHPIHAWGGQEVVGGACLLQLKGLLRRFPFYPRDKFCL